MKKSKNHKMIKLRTKFTLLIGMAVLLVTFAVVVSGIAIHRESILKRYNETAYQTAETVEQYFEPGELAEYVRLASEYVSGSLPDEKRQETLESDRYCELQRLVDILREGMNANDIFICTFDIDELGHYDEQADLANQWNPLIYVMDSYYEDELQMRLGDSGAIFPEYCEEILKSYESGVHSDDYFLADGQFGYTIAALYPVVSQGETIGFIAVEIPMVTLQADMAHFIFRIVVAASVTAVLLLFVILAFLMRTMIFPIKLVSREAEVFVQNNNAVSEKLSLIRTHDEIQILSESILKLENEINSYIENLTKVTAEKERIGAELNVATQIQADMLPSIFPAFPEREEIDIFASMTPAKEVGGDFYDFFMVDERNLAVVVADVSGKGVPAALFMVIGKTLLKDHTQTGRDLGEVFTEVNNILCESNDKGMFITAFEGVLDLVTGEFRYVNAGHEPPFICHKDGSFEQYRVRPGFVLAGMENMKYKEQKIQLGEGDRLFQYTDGVTEAMNGEKQLYGMDRLCDILNKKCISAAPRQILELVKGDIDAFVGKEEQFDDITMLCLEYRKAMEI